LGCFYFEGFLDSVPTSDLKIDGFTTFVGCDNCAK
jgi:hypothetical protein